MKRSFSIKSILAVSSALIMSIMSSTAGAWTKTISSGQITCPPCSIETEGLLQGIGNLTINPVAFRVLLAVREGVVFALNPATNTGGDGVPFVGASVVLTSSDLIGFDQVIGKGKALGDVTIHDPEIIAGILVALDDQCNDGNNDACTAAADIRYQQTQHPNWELTVVATSIEVLGQEWEDNGAPGCNIDGDPTGCYLNDALGNDCVAPAAVIDDPHSWIWTAFSYECTTVCHDKTGPTCPSSLPLP